MSKEQNKKYICMLSVFYIFILFTLNFIRIFDNNFWGDEAFTIQLAQMDFSTMLQATAVDVHPPLYYIIVQFLCKIFGCNGVVFHVSAFIPYVIIIAVALTKVRTRFGWQTSIIFITFASILPNAVKYNVEARMYTWGGYLFY